MVTKRVLKTVNYLKDWDGKFTSYRIILDKRKCKQGLFANNHKLDQWQIQFMVKKKTDIRKPEYSSFTNWAIKEVSKFTNFYCGSNKKKVVDSEEVGFHSSNHIHYNQLSPKKMRQELSAAIEEFFLPGYPKAIRAPGLLWSSDYFKSLGELGFHIDSSFKETNHLEPIFPMITDGCWWEIPVTGNILNNSKFKQMVDMVLISGGVLSLYAHDHDLVHSEEKKRYVEIVSSLLKKDFRPTGYIEFFNWLRSTQDCGIREISQSHDGTLSITAQIIPECAIVLNNLALYRLKKDNNKWSYKSQSNPATIIYTGDEGLCNFELIRD